MECCSTELKCIWIMSWKESRAIRRLDDRVYGYACASLTYRALYYAIYPPFTLSHILHYLRVVWHPPFDASICDSHCHGQPGPVPLSPPEPQRSRIQGYSHVSRFSRRTRAVDARLSSSGPTGVSPTLPCTSRFYGGPPSLKSPSLPRGDPTSPLVACSTGPDPGGGISLKNTTTTSAALDVLNPAYSNLCATSLGDRQRMHERPEGLFNFCISGSVGEGYRCVSQYSWSHRSWSFSLFAGLFVYISCCMLCIGS